MLIKNKSGDRPDPREKGSPERQAVKQLLEKMDGVADSAKLAGEQVSDALKRIEALEGSLTDDGSPIDVAEIRSMLDEHAAFVDEVRRGIRNTKDGMWFPGVEDAGKKFSMLRASIGHLRGGTKEAFEKNGAGHEFEVITEARKAVETRGAGHVVGIDSSGGTFVPDQVLDDLIEPIYTRSAFINLGAADGTTRVTALDGLYGSPVKVPRGFSGMNAYWIGEEDEYIQSQMRTGTLTMTPKKMGLLAGLTDEMMRFASPAFETMLRNDMIRGASKKMDWTIMYGTGTDDMPRGIANMLRHGTGANSAGQDADGNYKPGVNWFWNQTGEGGPTASVPGSSSADFDITFDALMNMKGVLEDIDIDPDDSFAFITHPRVWRRLRQLKVLNFSGQTEGQPYLLGAPMITRQRLTDLIGPHDHTTQIPTTKDPAGTAGAKYADMFAGNLRELLWGRWSGIEIVDDEGKGTGFARDITWVKYRMYCDIAAREQRALVYSPDVRARD